MIFDDVVSGSAWQPESAARYNAVNALLRESAPLPPLPQQSKGGWAVGRVSFYNASNAVIAAYHAVALSPGTGSGNRLNCLSGTPAVSDTALWGIAQSNVPAGCCGEAVVSGITQADIVTGGNLALNCLTPQSGGLVRTASGRAQILSCAPGGTPALILLGYGGSTAEYNGFFKLLRTESGVAVVNGADPTGSVCGYTDLPGCGEVTRAEITGNSGTVTLYVHYNETTRSYQTSFTESSGAVLTQIIGTYTASTITQSWQGDTIRFARSYFL